MQQRACVARAPGARVARCALLTTLVGVLWETALQVHRHGVRCALPIIRESAARAPAFGFHCSCVCAQLSPSLRLFLCRISLSFSAGSQRLFLRLSLHLSLSLCGSLCLRVSLALLLDSTASATISLRFSLSSYRPRLHWRSRQDDRLTSHSGECLCVWVTV